MQTVNKTNIKQIINDYDSDPLFERKIQNATDGLNHDCFNWLDEKVAKFSKGNAAVIADYIMRLSINIVSTFISISCTCDSRSFRYKSL